MISKGIQKRFQEATRKRKYDYQNLDYWLLFDKKGVSGGNNSYTDELSAEKTPQSKVNYKKEIYKEKPVRFSIPSLEEVKNYCLKRQNNIDASHFVDYYQSRGWELSNGKKMKDWRAAIRTWEKRNFVKQKGGNNGTNTGKLHPALQ